MDGRESIERAIALDPFQYDQHEQRLQPCERGGGGEEIQAKSGELIASAAQASSGAPSRPRLDETGTTPVAP